MYVLCIYIYTYLHMYYMCVRVCSLCLSII